MAKRPLETPPSPSQEPPSNAEDTFRDTLRDVDWATKHDTLVDMPAVSVSDTQEIPPATIKMKKVTTEKIPMPKNDPIAMADIALVKKVLEKKAARKSHPEAVETGPDVTQPMKGISVSELVDAEIPLLYKNLEGKAFTEELPANELNDLRIEAVRRLLDKTTNKQQVEKYKAYLEDLKKNRIAYVAKSIKEKAGTMQRDILQRKINLLKEGEAVAALEIEGLQREKNPRYGARIMESERYRAEARRELAEQEFAMRQLETPGELPPLATEAHPEETALEDSLALHQKIKKEYGKDPIIAREADKKIAELERQIKERDEFLSRREVNLVFGETRPRVMGGAGESVKINVSSGRPAEKVEKMLAPFIAVERSLQDIYTRPLFDKDEYVPGRMLSQRAQLVQQREDYAKSQGENSPEIRNIDRLISKIDSAIQNVDYDRLSEAMGAIENKLSLASEKYNTAEDEGSRSAWRGEVERYSGMLHEASRDALTVYANEISADYDNLQDKYNVSADDINRMLQGKVTFFSSPGLWFTMKRMGSGLEKLRAKIRQKEDAKRRLDAGK